MALTPGKASLLNRMASALHMSGWQVLWLNDDHPARAQFIKGDARLDVWIHIWNVTPGGRPKQRPLERRIQPTGIGDHFKTEAGTDTLIFGWSDEAQVFAAFDHGYHSGQIGNSPSIQTDLPSLLAANQDGLGVFAKATGELSISIRPDFLGIYFEQRQLLHSMGSDAAQLSALRQMAVDPLRLQVDDLPQNRRKVLTNTLRVLRDRRFREHVLTAYRHRCAMCGIQLELLDAAHILPVAHPKSNDKVTNGVALCALHHRAYDAGLVTFDRSYSISINQDIAARLASASKDEGLTAFHSALLPSLLLPKMQANYPSPKMITIANELRGWAK
ncbi:HNH endonuclease [Citromicrobium bathyomarinum]